MRNFLLAFAVIFGAVACVAQVDEDVWRVALGSKALRSDGIFVDVKGNPYVIQNGEVAGPIGVGFKEEFGYGDGIGMACHDAWGVGVCEANTTLVGCSCVFGSGVELFILPLVTADIMLDMDATSLDIGSDQASNDGLMILSAYGGASGRPFVVGDDAAFYFCANVAVEDVSGIDASILAGFFAIDTADVWNADFEALDVYAGIGILGTAASALTVEDVTIKTELDANADGTGDGVATTDTTDSATDATEHKYCTYVSSTGVTTFTFDNSPPTTTATYTFADGDMVVPGMTYLHTTDLAGEIDVTLWEVGYQ